ncbi:hypothetical protein ABVT39_013023 [Epinephelus coioides]
MFVMTLNQHAEKDIVCACVTLLQAGSDRGRALRNTLGGQEAPPAIPLRGHQQELPTSQNKLNQKTPSVISLRASHCGAEGAARPSSYPEGSLPFDHDTKERCVGEK